MSYDPNLQQVYFPSDGVRFNPELSDYDFRVSGDGQTYLLHADAGLDQVAIGQAANTLSNTKFSVLYSPTNPSGNYYVTDYRSVLTGTSNFTSNAYLLSFQLNTDIRSGVTQTGGCNAALIQMYRGSYATDVGYTENIQGVNVIQKFLNYAHSTGYSQGFSSTLQFDSGTSGGHYAFSATSTSAGGTITGQSLHYYSYFPSPAGALTASKQLAAYFIGGSVAFSPYDTQTFDWNQGQLDCDVRIRGSGTANLLYCDASANRVGVRNSAPYATFNVEGVAGTTCVRINGDGAAIDDVLLVGSDTNAYCLYVYGGGNGCVVAGAGGGPSYNERFKVSDGDSTTTSGYHAAFNVYQNYNPPSNSAHTQYGFYILTRTQGAYDVTGGVYMSSQTLTKEGSGNVPIAYGQQMNMVHSGSGTVGSTWYVAIMSTSVLTSTGNTTNFYDFFCQDSTNISTGTVVNRTGLYIEEFVRASSAANRYAIFARGNHCWFNVDNGDYDYRIDGTSDYLFFGDASTNRVGIRTNTPNATLDVRGVAATPSLIVNEDGVDSDSRIEGDTDQYLTFWDASADKVGIGDSTPDEKLDVAGKIRWDGTGSAGGVLTHDNTADCTYDFPRVGGGVKVCMASGTSTVTVSNTTTPTTLIPTVTGTVTMPANGFEVGRTWKFTASGIFSTDLAAATASMTITVEVGGTVYATCATGNLPVLLTDKGWRLEGEITCRTTGAGGTAFTQAILYVQDATYYMNWGTNAATNGLDTTVTKAFDIKAQWGEAKAGDSWKLTNFLLNVEN
jgi:hypothetical protein